MAQGQARRPTLSCGGLPGQEHPRRAVGGHLDVCWAPSSDVRTPPTPPTHPHAAWRGLLLLVWNPGPTWPFSPIFSAPWGVSARPALAECAGWPSPSQHPGSPHKVLGTMACASVRRPCFRRPGQAHGFVGHMRVLAAWCLGALLPWWRASAAIRSEGADPPSLWEGPLGLGR